MRYRDETKLETYITRGSARCCATSNGGMWLTNVMDTYSFGHQVIRAGQSEITIALPYEMGKSTKICPDDGYQLIFMDLLQTIW